MLATILQRIFQQLILLIVVSIVLLAAYVSLGRQFMPVISNYSEFLENQILEATGIPVSVESLTGSFSGFNPVINIDGLGLAVADDSHPDEVASNAFFFDSATIVVDMARSVWQRRWVLEEFVVESLELDLQQNANGGWQLSGVDMVGGEPVDPNDLYQTFLSFTRLDLRNVAINVSTQSGDSFILTNGLATIQNQGNSHYLHINANLEQNPQQVSLSLEVQGSELDELAGQLHVSMPPADYSALMTAANLQGMEFQQVNGAAELWINFTNGNVVGAQSSFALEDLALSIDGRPALEIAELSGKTAASRGMAGEHWEIALAEMAIVHDEQFWRDFNGFIYFMPGQMLSTRFDHIEVALLTELALNSGLLNATVAEDLQAYSPAGGLRNFSLSVPLVEGSADAIRLRTNIAGVELGSVRGSPNMWGLDGYLEMQINQASGQVSGIAEVESENFSLNIPTTFTRVWDFDYVNGRLYIEVDASEGQRVRLQSNVVVAQSSVLDGRVKFSSVVQRHEDGERDANLELLVGASRVDAEYKELFLPDGSNVGANLRDSMEFLEQAILDGDIRDSGVLFRGSSVGGSPPVSKTFQSFFVLDNGELNYNDEWPRLNNISGLVITDDNKIDIGVSAGSSGGIQLQQVAGRIRQDENFDSWLTIEGKANGTTAQGLDFLQAIPVEEGLKQTFRNWVAVGDINADVNVLIPLGQEETEPDVRLEMELLDNELDIPEFDLAVSNLSGPVVFDTRSGLEDSTLKARLFGDEVTLMLSSTFDAGRMQQVFIQGTGTTTPEELIAWPGQSEVVRNLLATMEGAFDYTALMTIDQTETANVQNLLGIESDLIGAQLNLPYPLAKSMDTAMPLNLQIGFSQEQLNITGTMGSQLQLQLEILDGVVNEGILTLGQDMPQAELLSPESDSGLVILGDIDRFELEPWTDFVASIGAAGGSADAYGNNIAFIDIATESFSLYDQELAAVNFRVEPENMRQGWLAAISSDAVQGEVLIPYDSQDYLQVDLDYLVLPAEEEAGTVDESAIVEGSSAEQAAETEVAEEQRVDPLLNLDPRELPLMQFATDSFAIGERQFGSWAFTLTPTNNGADFNDINFDFRGLRLGRDELSEDVEDLVPHFRWSFDGNTHHSELEGVLVADDIGGVLQANGYAPSLQSNRAIFVSEVNWPGTPAFFSADHLSGRIDFRVEDGRFNRNSGGQGALRLVSFINLTAVFQRLRFSDDLLRRGLAYDEITGRLSLDDGMMHIEDRLVITGPSSLYQITGDLDLREEVIEGEMFVTLPVSNNLPWIGLLTANIPLAVGAYLFDQIFGDQVDSLSSAVYTLSGPLAGLEPEFKQAFGSPPAAAEQAAPPVQ